METLTEGPRAHSTGGQLGLPGKFPLAVRSRACVPFKQLPCSFGLYRKSISIIVLELEIGVEDHKKHNIHPTCKNMEIGRDNPLRSVILTEASQMYSGVLY